MTAEENYFNIINCAKIFKIEDGQYTERHHIAPQSICPLLKKSTDNIVELSAKDHFMAHYYIWKWFEEIGEKRWAAKMWCAITRMYKRISKYMSSEELSDASKKFAELRGNVHLSDETR